MYRRLLLSALLGLTLSACVPYYDGGQSYYRSEVYTSPAPAGNNAVPSSNAVPERSNAATGSNHGDIDTPCRRHSNKPAPVRCRPRNGSSSGLHRSRAHKRKGSDRVKR